MKSWAPGLKDNVELSTSKSGSSTNSLKKLVELILQKTMSYVLGMQFADGYG